MNLSDFSEEQRSQAAEFVAKKLWVRCEPELNVDYQAIAQGLLTSTDEAVKALESVTKEEEWNCDIVLRRHGNSSITYSEGVLGQYDQPFLILNRCIRIKFNDHREMPAAITLAVALAMGFKVEEEK